MEQQDTNQESPLTETKKKPVFLTVLCILSLVFIGLGIIKAINNLISFFPLTRIMDHNSIENFTYGGIVKWGRIIFEIQIFANLICFVGVLMMWKLKKMGFFIFLFGAIVIAASLSYYAMIGGFGPLGIFILSLGLIYPIAFITMFGLNFKHMS